MLQKRQLRVQFAPSIMNVAVCLRKHSPRLGQLASLQTVQVGDEVEIFGPENSIDKLAEIGGTIPYELSCAVSKRVPRVYRRSGEVVGRELLLRF